MILFKEIYLGIKFLSLFTGIFKSNKILVQDLKLKSILKKNKFYKARIYRTTLKQKKEKIIFLAHGMSAFGIEDDRLFELAKNLSKMNFTVITPEFDEVKSLKILPETIQNIRDCFFAIENLFPNSEIGFFSVSFSAGMGLVAFSEPEIAKRVKSILCVGAFFDLQETAKFVVDSFEKDAYGTFILFYNFFDFGFKGKNLKDLFLARALDNGMKRHNTSLELSTNLEKKLTNEERKIYTQIQNDIRFRNEIAQKIISKTVKFSIQISPKFFVSNIKANLHLIHGKNDFVIPEAETIRLSKLLSENNIKHSVCFTELLSHGDRVSYLNQLDKMPNLAKSFGMFFKNFE